MSKIEELIKKLCPNGVEYKKLSDIKESSFWLMPSTPKYEKSGVPYITSKNIKNGNIDFNNINYITKEKYEEFTKNRNILSGDILISMIGTIGEVSIVQEFNEFYGQNIYLVRLDNGKILNKYYYYYITQLKIKNSLVSKKNASSQGYIKAGSIENMVIPVPPLEVQHEIVHILDDFTLLTAELTAELTARQKQYEYYQKNLLTEINSNSKYKLVEIQKYFKRLKGTNITAGKMKEIENNNGNIKIFAGGKTMIMAKEEDIPNPNITKIPAVLVQSRGIIDFIYYDKPFTFKNEMWAYTCENQITLKYLYYVLKSNINYYRTASIGMGAMPQISLGVTEKFKIKIPPLEEQERIVNILDRFDKLCNDISEGLPAEIEARKKQYEYYRDKLLTFKELEV